MGSSLGGGQAGVNLDQVNGNEAAGLVDRLADEVTLTQSQTTTDGGTGTGSPHGVEGVDVEGQVDGSVGTDVSEGHLDNAANTVTSKLLVILFNNAPSVTGSNIPINIEHAESLDVVVTENLLLVVVNVAQTNVYELADVQLHVVLDPAKVLLLIVLGEASEESEGHAVDVSTVAALGGVDVGVSIDPDDGDLTVEALAGGLSGTGNGTNGNTVVTTEGKGQAPLGGVLVGGFGNLAVDSRNGQWVLHATVVGVGGGSQILVLLNLLVAVKGVAELSLDLVEQARLDESSRAVVDTSLGLNEAKVVNTAFEARKAAKTACSAFNLPDHRRSQRQQHPNHWGWKGNG
mgnify:CR=1 FL=1